jgi:type VI secretion system protein ImpH
MAASVGTENPDIALEEVREALFREPWTFDFFQAVRLLGLLEPDRSPVGRYAQPKDETVRFGARPSLNFPPSAIHSLAERKDACPAMDVNFLGLIGPLGVMPNYLTEMVASRVRAHDTAMLEFLNIFNHRLTSFFYQAWEKNHFTVAYERDRKDPITGILYSLIGFGTPGLRDRQPVDDELFVFYSGLFSMLPKSAMALEAVIGDYFDVPVEIQPFVGCWRSLDDRDQCTFETEPFESTQLGFGAVVGDEVWDQQSRVRIRLGPLKAVRYRDFLPNGAAWPRLRAITRAFSGNDLEFEIQLVLERESVPAFELRNPDDRGLRLGWQTWFKSGARFDRDPEDTILLLNGGQ